MVSICKQCSLFYFHPIWITEIEQSFACETSFYFQSSNFSLFIGISSLCIFNIIFENKVYTIVGVINETIACISMDLLIVMVIEAFELADLFPYIVNLKMVRLLFFYYSFYLFLLILGHLHTFLYLGLFPT